MTFDPMFQIVVGTEGGYTNNPHDPGNWTGGAMGVGECRGTKYGISASAYPNKDIANLTADQAKAIYATDYWVPIHGDNLPKPLALLVFDAAVNNGTGRAVKWLQGVLGVPQDGVMGNGTLAALAHTQKTGAEICAEYMTARTLFMTALPTWHLFPGWAARLCRLPFQAIALGD